MRYSYLWVLLAATHMLVFWTYPVVAATDLNDVRALEDLYVSLNQPSQLVGWKLGGGDPCEESWKGVSCSGSSIIFMYNLSGLNLGGHLGDQLSQLVSLKQLNVSFNHINGEIPSSLPPNVTHLDFSFNHFSGRIPYSILYLKNLQHLNLSHNNLGVRNIYVDQGSPKEDYYSLMMVGATVFAFVAVPFAVLVLYEYTGEFNPRGRTAEGEIPTGIRRLMDRMFWFLSFFKAQPPDLEILERLPNPPPLQNIPNPPPLQNIPNPPPLQNIPNPSSLQTKNFFFLVLLFVGSVLFSSLKDRKKKNKDVLVLGAEGSIRIPSFSSQDPLFTLRAYIDCRRNKNSSFGIF